MLMRNPDYHLSAEQVAQSPIVTTPARDSRSSSDDFPTSDSYSQREMLLGHTVLLLLFVIALLLRSWGM